MRISTLAGYALGATIAFTALAGCGGGSQIAPTTLTQSAAWSQSVQRPAFQNGRLNSFLARHGTILQSPGVTRPSFMDPKAVRKPLVFLADGANVGIFLQGGENKMVGQVSGFQLADALATDTARDLYVVDYFADNVTVYAPPYTDGPKLTFQPGRYPGNIAVSRQGTVAVQTCTILSGSQCGPGVLFFAAGSTTPCATVRDQDIGYAGFDRKGNLYTVGRNSSNTTVVGKIDGGCNAKRVRTLTINNTIGFPGDIEVDKAGRIAILDSSYNDAVIDTYNPPKRGSLGSPISITPLTVPYYAGPFIFQASGRGLWLLYQTYGSSSETASEYAYPAGGAAQKSIISTASQTYDDVAVTPVLVPGGKR